MEFGFKFAFSGVMTPSVLGGALVWWRFYSFYLYVVLGALAAGNTVLRALRTKSHTGEHAAPPKGTGTLTAPGTEREPL